MSEAAASHPQGRRFFLASGLPVRDGRVDLPLTPADVRHLTAVLRTGPGDVVSVVEPDGRTWRVRIVSSSDRVLSGEILEEVGRVQPLGITLYQGMATGGKMDLVVEKASELNIAAFVPVISRRSSVRLDPKGRAERGERLRRVARAAAKQAGRGSLMRVDDPVTLAEVASACPAYDAMLVVWESADVTGVGVGEALDESPLTAGGQIAVVVGPEGGLESSEVYTLEAAGARAVTLGQTVLRTETAGIVAAALCAYELGGLGGRPRA